MSSASSYPRCALEIRPSSFLAAAVVLPAGAAALLPWLSGMPPFAALTLSALSFLLALRLRPWWRGELSYIAWLPDGRWLLTGRDDQQHEASFLMPGILLGARLMALHWRCEECGQRLRVALAWENADRDDVRRLRVRLRLSSDAELFGRKDQG